jgi:hypothetical protein
MPRSPRPSSKKSGSSTKNTDGAIVVSPKPSDSAGPLSARFVDISAVPLSQPTGNAPVKRKVGRPPEPVPEHHAADLIAWLSNGKPLREWCRQDGRPHFTAVYDWMDKDEEFALRIARAREDGHDVIADQCVTLADTQPVDQVEVAWRRLQVETRLKLLAKWNPKKYGDRQQLEHGGGVILNVITGVPDA